jgi:dTDP-4-amino-4,6-dideoxygalactose transaminase
MQVPFLDLKAQYKQIEAEVLPMIKEAMENGAFIGGPNVTGFEKEFAEFCRTKFCVGVNSGTDALRFALMAAGVGPGDEVITVPNTFIATTEAISQVGAVPVFVDVAERTCNMDPAKLQEFLEQNYSAADLTSQPVNSINQSTHQPANYSTQSTNQLINPSTKRPVRALIPVHLYGQPADMDPIMEIAQTYHLAVIEDACQAHGAGYRGKAAGAIGAAGCFSFYPGKNLGAYGEGGAVVTDDPEVAQKIRVIRDHGQQEKYIHAIEGYNGRLDAIQAGVLRIKLKRLKQWNQARQTNAALYDELLGEIPGVRFAEVADFAESVYHLYVIMLDDRDGLQQFLAEKGIATGLHYPLPLHRQKAYEHLGYQAGAFPVAEKAAARLLSLPMYPELTRIQIEYVADCIKKFKNRS